MMKKFLILLLLCLLPAMAFAEVTLVAENDRVVAAQNLIAKVTAETPKDVIIVFYGAGVSQEEVAQLQSFLETNYPMVDVGFVDGKQAIYDFIISLE